MKRKTRLLFVDDEVRVVRLLRVMFRDKYEVHTATSGQEALDLLQHTAVDIVVSDQRMPKMLGIQLLARIRERWPRITRLLLTGYADLAAVIGAVNDCEVYRFLGKPWSNEELKAVIDECAAVAIATANSPAHFEQAMQEAADKRLLSLDATKSSQQEVVTFFNKEYDVIATTSIDEAKAVVSDPSVGALIVGDTFDEHVDLVAALREFRKINSSLTIVILSNRADSNWIIQLINQAHIHRFHVKPVNPDEFRPAVAAAMRMRGQPVADPSVTVLSLQPAPTADSYPSTVSPA